MKRKLLLSILTMAITICSISVMPLSVSAESEKLEEIVLGSTTERTYDEFEYVDLADGTIEITKYIGTDSKASIPHKIDGKVVSSIGELAFANNKELTFLFMYGSVTNIADNAFDGCENVVFDTYSDAYACKYAAEHGILCCVLEDVDPTKNEIEPGNNVMMGDINSDGKITTADVGLANSFASGEKEPSDIEFLAADVNGDRKITTSDVGKINLTARLGSELISCEYEATVLKVEDGKVLTVETYLYSESEATDVNLEYADNAQISSDIAVGDKVVVTSSGFIIETFPPIICDVTSVVKVV